MERRRPHDRAVNSPRRRAHIVQCDRREVGGGGQGELIGHSALALPSCSPPCPGGVGGGSAAAREKATIRHRSEEHPSELQSLMRSSSAVFCLPSKSPLQNSREHYE